jgi:hypothetical protein
MMSYLFGGNAQIGIDTLQNVSAVMRQRLAVDVKQHSQKVTSEARQVFNVLGSSGLGDSALQNQIVLLGLDGKNSLVGLDQVLESAADLDTQLSLFIENVR